MADTYVDVYRDVYDVLSGTFTYTATAASTTPQTLLTGAFAYTAEPNQTTTPDTGAQVLRYRAGANQLVRVRVYHWTGGKVVPVLIQAPAGAITPGGQVAQGSTPDISKLGTDVYLEEVLV